MKGYTLVELLVVITIISILTVVGFVNYRTFSADQIAIKAFSQVQTYLRLAQSNSSTSTLCSNKTDIGPWLITFKSDGTYNNTLELSCGPLSTVEKSLTLENAEVKDATGNVGIVGSDCGGSSASLPFSVKYPSATTSAVFSYSGATNTCLSSARWTFTVRSTKDTSNTKSFILNKGGAIDVQ